MRFAHLKREKFNYSATRVRPPQPRRFSSWPQTRHHLYRRATEPRPAPLPSSHLKRIRRPARTHHPDRNDNEDSAILDYSHAPLGVGSLGLVQFDFVLINGGTCIYTGAAMTQLESNKSKDSGGVAEEEEEEQLKTKYHVTYTYIKLSRKLLSHITQDR